MAKWLKKLEILHSIHTTDSFAIDHIVKNNLFLVSWGKGKDFFFFPAQRAVFYQIIYTFATN